jgi:ADP-ribosylglycohydrolase
VYNILAVNIQQIEGSIYGLLCGNALGFACAGKKSTYSIISQQLVRQFTDIGAMALATMSALNEAEKLDLEEISHNLLEWYLGAHAHLGSTEPHDSRITISESLRNYSIGMPSDRGGAKSTNDNSALIRMLPIAIWNLNSPIDQTVLDAHEVCKITNQSILTQVCSALYCLVIQNFLQNKTAKASLQLELYYNNKSMQQYLVALKQLRDAQPNEPNGSNNVIDSFWTSMKLYAQHNKNFEEGAIQAIMLDNDIEATAALTGSLIGATMGVKNIPTRWMQQLECPEAAKAVIKQFIKKVNERV